MRSFIIGRKLPAARDRGHAVEYGPAQICAVGIRGVMLLSFISLLLGKRRPTSPQAAFRERKAPYLEFLRVAERRAVEVTPEHSVVWQNAFRLQRLLVEQLCLRFEHLVGNQQLDLASESIARIEERLGSGWSEAEEAALKESLPSYKEISREIDAMKSRWRPLDKSLVDALQADSEYREARIALSDNANRRPDKLGG